MPGLSPDGEAAYIPMDEFQRILTHTVKGWKRVFTRYKWRMRANGPRQGPGYLL